MLHLAFVLFTALLTTSAAAQHSAEFPRDGTYIIQLTGPQFSSGYGEYLVPPLLEAFDRTGMRNKGGPGAEYIATVDSVSDVGAWHGSGDARAWLYERRVIVGLTPSDVDVAPNGELAPAFSVSAVLLTPDADRTDEFKCLVALATRELAARYLRKGHVAVNGRVCARN